MRTTITITHVGKPADNIPEVPEPAPIPAKPAKSKQTEADSVGAATTPKE